MIITEDLSKFYGWRLGVEHVNLEVPEGAVFGFLGPNGSGKTTTIRVLLGLHRPSQGRAAIFGLDCWKQSHRIKAQVGYLPGELRLYPWMTGREALRIFGLVRGSDLFRQYCRTAGELADRFSLELDVRVRKMSRGMRQKLGLILALAHHPKLLILDEPTSSLDPIMQERLKQYLRMLAARGHTIFFSSHALSEVEDLCDRVAILREGRLVADERLDELRARAKREVTIRWKREAKATELVPPSCLKIHLREDHFWRCGLSGAVSELTHWIATQAIEDLTIGRPDLESVFRQFYEQGTDS